MTLFNSLPPAEGSRWTIETVVPGRLHLSRGPVGEFALFLEGSVETFGELPRLPGVSHSDSVIALPGGQTIAALRIASRDQLYGNRVISHIAYELGRRLESETDVPNDDLMAGIAWVLPLLGEQEAVLSAERQIGLVGECVFLLRLIGAAARLRIPGRVALVRWKGSGTSKRDFAAAGVAVEAKTTSHATRLHHFGSIEQLDAQTPEEEVFLFSLGIRHDASSPKCLPDYVLDVETSLLTRTGEPDSDGIAAFRQKLVRYGYDPIHESLYRAQPGFRPPHLAPTLYREKDLDRVRLTSFRGDALPSMVVNVGYDLEVRGNGLTGEEADAVLERLLMAPPLSSGS